MNGKFNIVDHIIGNGLDCIKCNLRDRSGTINHLNGCMRFDNSCGLCWDVKDNAWRFRWSVNKTRYNKNFNVIKYKDKNKAFDAAMEFRKKKYDAQMVCGNSMRKIYYFFLT